MRERGANTTLHRRQGDLRSLLAPRSSSVHPYDTTPNVPINTAWNTRQRDEEGEEERGRRRETDVPFQIVEMEFALGAGTRFRYRAQTAFCIVSFFCLSIEKAIRTVVTETIQVTQASGHTGIRTHRQIGRASCRERVSSPV